MKLKPLYKKVKHKALMSSHKMAWVKRSGPMYLFDEGYKEKCRIKYKKNKMQERSNRLYGEEFARDKQIIKLSLFRNGNHRCFWCTKRLKRKTATIDHIIPVSVIPRNNKVSNLRLMHDHCRVVRDRAIQKGIIV